MSWPDREAIEKSVVDLLRVNLSMKPGDKLLVVCDFPRAQDWQSLAPSDLADRLERTMLGRLMVEIGNEHFDGSATQLLVFPATGRHGQ